jgi:hypothetical protein
MHDSMPSLEYYAEDANDEMVDGDHGRDRGSARCNVFRRIRSAPCLLQLSDHGSNIGKNNGNLGGCPASPLSSTSLNSTTSGESAKEALLDTVGDEADDASGPRLPMVTVCQGESLLIQTAKVAEARVKDLLSDPTYLFANIDICTFERREVITGRCLGHGSFALVQEIRGFAVGTTNGRNESVRQNMAENCITSSGKAQYAIKEIRSDLAESARKNPSKKVQRHFRNGVVDLLVESKILSQLEHPVRNKSQHLTITP